MSHIHFVLLPATSAFVLRANGIKDEMLHHITHPIDVKIDSTHFDLTIAQRKAKWSSYCIVVISNKCGNDEVVVDFRNRSPQKMSISDFIDLINSFSDETDDDINTNESVANKVTNKVESEPDNQGKQEKSESESEDQMKEKQETESKSVSSEEPKGGGGGCLIM